MVERNIFVEVIGSIPILFLFIFSKLRKESKENGKKVKSEGIGGDAM